MLNWRLYASSGIFVAVTVLKLLFSDMTAAAREEVVTLIDMDMDYRAMAVQVGSVLTYQPVQQVLHELAGESMPAAAELTPTPEPAPTVTPVPVTPSPSPSPTAVPSRLQAAVEAFLLAQSAYADYDTPEKVSYDLAEISFDYVAPVSGVTSSGFGYRVHPIEGQVAFHYGTDYAVPTGTEIVAFADGEVTMAGYEKGYGNYVQLTHADGWKTLYAHCDEVQVYWGQKVHQGDVIALSGETGTATGPHLHLELTHNDLYTNPEFYF